MGAAVSLTLEVPAPLMPVTARIAHAVAAVEALLRAAVAAAAAAVAPPPW